MAKPNVVQDLQVLLADHQVFYQKLRGYHWNVRGPLFFALHAKFEEMYLDAAERVDALAERVTALGGRPVSTLAGQLEIARLQEDSGAPSASDMVHGILSDLEALGASLRAGVAAAGKLDDVATANMLEGWADAQEKTAWMLRAFLDQ